jgi:hypothetical protein
VYIQYFPLKASYSQYFPLKYHSHTSNQEAYVASSTKDANVASSTEDYMLGDLSCFNLTKPHIS